MTKEKWFNVVMDITNSANVYIEENFSEVEPEDWVQIKKLHLKCIKEIDEATEAYFMENGRK